MKRLQEVNDKLINKIEMLINGEVLYTIEGIRIHYDKKYKIPFRASDKPLSKQWSDTWYKAVIIDDSFEIPRCARWSSEYGKSGAVFIYRHLDHYYVEDVYNYYDDKFLKIKSEM